MLKRNAKLLLLAMAVDALLINLAFIIAYYLRYELQWIRAVDEANWRPYRDYLPVALVLSAIILVLFNFSRVYSPRRGESWLDEAYRIASGTAMGIMTMIVIFFFYRPQFYSRLVFSYAAVLIAGLLSLERLGARQVMGYARRRGIGVDRVLIVGAGEIGLAIMRNIVAQPELGYSIVGFVDDSPELGSTDIGPFKALGGTDNIAGLVQDYAIDEVIIALPSMSQAEILKVMSQCEGHGVSYRIVPDLLTLSLSRVDVDDIIGIPTIGVKEVSIRGGNLALKRILDVTISLVGLVVLSPLMLLIAGLIKLTSPGLVLFAQVRAGRNGKPFTFYKFRSMYLGAEEEQETLAPFNEVRGPIFKIRDDPRLTPLGKVLRRTSLDELPQLYNVLRGEMSLVGPRPPLPSEVEQYRDWHRKRLEVPPGMTGLWQVRGRSKLTFDEMVMLDIYYIENWSLGLDLRILLRTVPVVLFASGAY